MKETYLVIIPPNEKAYAEKYDGALEQLQRVVGGYIETVRTQGNSDYILILDDEGKLKDKPVNKPATVLYGNPLDVIVGTVILARVEGDIVGFDKETAEDFSFYVERLR